MSELLVVSVLRFLWHSFKFLSGIFSIIYNLLIFFGLGLGGFVIHNFHSNGIFNLLIYYILFPICYLIVTISYPLLYLYPFLTTYKIYWSFIASEGNGYLTNAASILAVFIVFVSASIRSVVWLDEQSYRSFLDYIFPPYILEIWFTLQGHAIIYIISTLCLLLNPYRFIKFLYRALSKNSTEFKPYLTKCATLAILDIVTLPFLFIILVTTWRIPHCLREIKNGLPNINTNHTNRYHVFLIRQGLGILFYDIPAFLICIPICSITFYRIPSFFKKLYKANAEDRARCCFDELAESIIDIPFLLMGSIILLFVYRAIPLFGEFKDKDRKNSYRRITFQQFIKLLLDVPMVISLILLYVTGYRWYLMKELQNEMKLKKNYLYLHESAISQMLELILDIIYFALFATPVILTLWRAPHLKTEVFIKVFYNEKFFDPEEEDEIEKPKFKIIPNEIFTLRRDIMLTIFKQWVIDVVHIAIGLCSLWRIPNIILHYLSILAVEEKAGSLRSKAIEEFINSILDVLALLSLVIITPFIYRIPIIISKIRNENTLYQFVVFDQLFELIKDLPYVVCAILSLWRIPVLIYKIWISRHNEYPTAKERRELALEQFKDTLLDIPFVISLILMILSIMHIFTIYLLYRKYKKFKSEVRDDRKKVREAFTLFRSKILKQLYLLPLQIPLIICTYLVTFTGYRLPVTIRIMKKIPGQKEPKKIAAKVIFAEAMSVLCDIPSAICMIIITLTVYRLKELKEVLSTNSFFHEDFEIKKLLNIYKNIFLVFWKLVRDIPLLILFLVSILTVWRLTTVLEALRNETDYRKRFALLGMNALLTILDIPCMLCTLIVLCSWRSKRVWNVLLSAYYAKRMSDIHFTIFYEFYQLLLDIPYILLTPFLLWRIPILLKKLKTLPTAELIRKEVLIQFKEALVDYPFIFMTILVVLSLYRNIELYSYYKKKKKEMSYRQFIANQTQQLLFDIPLILITIATCVVVPYRVYFVTKLLFFYKVKNERDNERRRELRVLLARTLVDVLTIIFGVSLLVIVWRIPFVINDYIFKKKTLRRTLSRQFFNGVGDILAVIALLINFILIYQFPYTIQRLFKFFLTCISHFKVWWKTERLRSSSNQTSNVKKVVKPHNGEVLPDDMLMEILLFLKPEEATQGFDLVCKNFHSLSRDDSFLWKTYLERETKNNYLDKYFYDKSIQNNNYNYNYNYNIPTHLRNNDMYYNSGGYKKLDFTRVFIEEFGEENKNRKDYVSKYVSTKQRYSTDVITEKDIRENDYKLGFRGIIFKETAHLFNLESYLLLPLKLTGLLLVIPNLFLGRLLYHFNIVKDFRMQEIYDSMNWTRIQEMNFFFIILLFLTIGMTPISGILALLSYFPFLNAKSWIPVDYYNFKHTKQGFIYYSVLSIASVTVKLISIIIGFALFISPLFYNVRANTLWLIHETKYIATPFNLLHSYLWSLDGQLFYIFMPHTIVMALYKFALFIIYWPSFILLAESGFFYWLSFILFYIVWIFIFGYGSFVFYDYLRHYYSPYLISSNESINYVLDLYLMLLIKPVKFCKYKLGFLGQLLIMVITVVWTAWPLVICYYFRYIVVFIVGLAASIFFLATAYRNLRNV